MLLGSRGIPKLIRFAQKNYIEICRVYGIS